MKALQRLSGARKCDILYDRVHMINATVLLIRLGTERLQNLKYSLLFLFQNLLFPGLYGIFNHEICYVVLDFWTLLYF